MIFYYQSIITVRFPRHRLVSENANLALLDTACNMFSSFSRECQPSDTFLTKIKQIYFAKFITAKAIGSIP